MKQIALNLIECKWPERLGGNMEKSGEQCTVGLALIVCKVLCIILCSPELHNRKINNTWDSNSTSTLMFLGQQAVLIKMNYCNVEQYSIGE